jgi:hypothetical protein
VRQGREEDIINRHSANCSIKTNHSSRSLGQLFSKWDISIQIAQLTECIHYSLYSPFNFHNFHYKHYFSHTVHWKYSELQRTLHNIWHWFVTKIHPLLTYSCNTNTNEGLGAFPMHSTNCSTKTNISWSSLEAYSMWPQTWLLPWVPLKLNSNIIIMDDWYEMANMEGNPNKHEKRSWQGAIPKHSTNFSTKTNQWSNSLGESISMWYTNIKLRNISISSINSRHILSITLGSLFPKLSLIETKHLYQLNETL